MGLPDFFTAGTRQWFENTLGEPTRVQTEAWPEIAKGRHTLVSAPTGTGKTLTAFLVLLDQMVSEARRGELSEELRLIYISPLKSLAADIRENLKRPLEGMLSEEEQGMIRVGIRTGDTTQTERQSMLRKPPHILITTPESLYLLLTGKGGQQMLASARCIILDELHAVMESKRGAHLMLSLARLDALHGTPLQRIGLSATVKPLSLAAEYLSPDEVAIVAPPMTKKVELMVLSPKRELQILSKDSVWRDIAARIYEECLTARTSIAFVDGRKFAEQLACYMLEIGGDDFARVHHGSLSKEKRHIVEQDLKEGRIRLLIATSSMELGIDVGEIDRVFQVGQPRTISSTMQRLGRAGHSPTKTSVMKIFPRTAEEALYCGMTAEVAKSGGIEELKPPKGCFDILAQHLVSMAAFGAYSVSEVMPILKRAYPFAEVTPSEVRGILRMLAGDYEHEENVPVRPRLLYDRIHDTVEGDNYSRMLAVASGGTIPDRGMFAVKTEAGVKVGEVEEEFTFETRVGDDFLLGSYSWKVQKITNDTIIVAPSEVRRARLPFWKGDINGRKKETGVAFGHILRQLEEAYHANQLKPALAKLGLDEECTKDAYDYIGRQIAATEVLPNDETVLLEHYRDETGNYQIMIHSVFGSKVNVPLAMLLQEHAQTVTKSTVNFVANDDGMVLFPYDGKRLPQGMLQELSPDTVRGMLSALVLSSPTFNIVFRYNANRALMMGVKSFKRQPLWVQRVRGAEMLNSVLSMEEDARQRGEIEEHPLIAETRRECLSDYFDVDGVIRMLQKVRSGEIKVREMFLETPSPMSFILRKKTEESLMYEYTPTPTGVVRTMEKRVAEQKNLILPEDAELKRVQERRKLPEDEKQLHSLLMMEGDVQAGELPVPVEWMEMLLKREQVEYIEPGLWIAAEQRELYETALGTDENEERDRTREKIVLRLIRYRGDYTIEELAERYLFSREEAEQLLDGLEEQGKLVLYHGSYYHRELFDRARTETVKSRRELTKTEPFAHFAAYLAEQRRILGTPSEQMSDAIERLCGVPFSPETWETVIFPSRVNGYREELLDKALSSGDFYFRMNENHEVTFERYDDADWDADVPAATVELTERERALVSVLLKRGACFLPTLTQVLKEEPPYEELLSLMEKGVVCTDSFGPVRYLNLQATVQKMPAKQRISTRIKLLSAGRWDLARPVRALTVEERTDRALRQTGILCRETIKSVVTGGQISWSEALEVLRIYEYTGKVRRGYFAMGLSGIQFIAADNYSRILSKLTHPEKELCWLNATDPAQVYGKLTGHMEGRSFMNVQGTLVALSEGVPVVVFERQGKVLRCFDESKLTEALLLFRKEFDKKRLYPDEKRLIVKEYDEYAKEALLLAGFLPEMSDYVLYR